MVTENIALRGYLGEKIVKKWLEKKYPDCDIVRQIIPIKSDGSEWKGGGHLDFGVIKHNKVKAIYEVKTQDYKIDEMNKAWKYIKGRINEQQEFEVQNDKEKRTIPADNNLLLKVVLLKGAKEGVVDIKDIVWFKEILNDKILDNLDKQVIDDIYKNQDILKEIKNIRNIAEKHKEIDKLK